MRDKDDITNDDRAEILYRYLYGMQDGDRIAQDMGIRPEAVMLVIYFYVNKGKVFLDEEALLQKLQGENRRLRRVLKEIREVADIQLAQLYYTDAELREALEAVVKLAEDAS